MAIGLEDLDELTAIYIMDWQRITYREYLTLDGLEEYVDKQKYLEAYGYLEESTAAQDEAWEYQQNSIDGHSDFWMDETGYRTYSVNEWDPEYNPNWTPSSDWDRTIELVKKMQEKGYKFELIAENDVYNVNFSSKTVDVGIVVDGLGMAKRAICKNALRAVGVLK